MSRENLNIQRIFCVLDAKIWLLQFLLSLIYLPLPSETMGFRMPSIPIEFVEYFAFIL